MLVKGKEGAILLLVPLFNTSSLISVREAWMEYTVMGCPSWVGVRELNWGYIIPPLQMWMGWCGHFSATNSRLGRKILNINVSHFVPIFLPFPIHSVSHTCKLNITPFHLGGCISCLTVSSESSVFHDAPGQKKLRGIRRFRLHLHVLLILFG